MNEPNMSEQQLQIMSGYEAKQLLHQQDDLHLVKWEYPLRMCRFILEDTARRVAASKELFPWAIVRGDCHSHTVHSDGRGTVAETAAMAKAAELDFQFVTDHWGVTQADECREHGLWVGQEPATEHHHMGILGLDHAFTPRMEFLADLAEAASLGATVFVPHPTGWWPAHIYSEEQKTALHDVPSPFLMEICNGGNNISSAFDYTDDSNIELWDRLLMRGQIVHAMGNTDAHVPHGIGTVWNCVFTDRCEIGSVLQELRLGHSFVSEAPLLHIALGEARMGDKADSADRDNTLQATAVDSRGLASVSIIVDGEVVVEHRLHGEAKWENTWTVPATAQRYVRVEVRSIDSRRAYSNPIYLS
jgi:hypothetical protein